MKRRKMRKGQAALEYAMIATVVGVLLLPAIYLFLHSSKESLEEIDRTQLDKLGRDIVATAEKVYYMGPPSRILLEPRMPDNVLNISIQKIPSSGINILLFNVTSSIARGVQTFAYDSPVSINGTFTAALENRSVAAGLKEINIEAYEQPTAGEGVIPFAYVNFGGRCPRGVAYDFDGDGMYDLDDRNFFANCFCGAAGWQKYRPSKTWQSGWFDPIAVGGNPFMVCANADYDADCGIDDDDVTSFCTTTALCTTGCVCAPAPSCS